jgi:hypothetical protein
MTLRTWIAGAFTAGLLAIPVSSSAQYSSPAPAIGETVGYDTSPNRALLYTGVGLFVGAYGTSAIVAAQSDRDADKKLYWPLAGPWLDLGNRQCDVLACDHGTRDKALLIVDGIAQGAGAFLMVSSIFVAEHHRTTYLQTHAFHVTPARLGQGAYGLSAFGAF